jgi:hypothetical protein
MTAYGKGCCLAERVSLCLKTSPGPARLCVILWPGTSYIAMDEIFPEMQKNKKYHTSEYDGHLNGLSTDAPAGLPVKKNP